MPGLASPVAADQCGGSVFLALKVLVVDEFGIWPYDREAATAFFTLVTAMYGRGSIILSSYKAFGEWGEMLGDTIIASAIWTDCCTTAMSSTPEERANGSGRSGRQVFSPFRSTFPRGGKPSS